jgi:hypothetical protein
MLSQSDNLLNTKGWRRGRDSNPRFEEAHSTPYQDASKPNKNRLPGTLGACLIWGGSGWSGSRVVAEFRLLSRHLSAVPSGGMRELPPPKKTSSHFPKEQ